MPPSDAWTPEGSAEGPTAVQRAAARVAFAACAAAVVVAIFWTGGVYTPTLALLWGLGVVTWVATLVTGAGRSARANPLAWLWLLMGVFSLVALVPLPRGLIGLLHANALTVADGAAAALGRAPPSFLPLAVHPGEAAYASAVYLVASGTALAASALPFSRRDASAAAHSLRGLAMLTLAAGAIWLLARLPLTVGLGEELRGLLRHLAPVNANHVSALLTAGLGIMLAFWHHHRVTDPAVRRVQTFAVLLFGLTIAFVPSRGGVLGSLLILALAKLHGRRPRSSLRVKEETLDRQARVRLLLQIFSVLCVLSIVALPNLKQEFLPRSRFEPLADLQSGHGKLAIMSELSAHLWDGWALGQGTGSLPVSVMMTPPFEEVRYEYVENFVLDRIVSQGLPFTILFVLLLLRVLVVPLRTWRNNGVFHGATLAIVGLLVHDFADFSLELPAGLYVLLAAATLLEQLRPDSWPSRWWPLPRRPSRTVALGAAGLALALAGGAVAMTWEARELDIPVAMRGRDADALERLVSERFAASHHAWYRLGRARYEAGDDARAQPALRRAVALKPLSRHANFVLAVSLHRSGGDAADPTLAVLDRPDDLAERLIRALAGDEAGRRTIERVLLREPTVNGAVGRWLAASHPMFVFTLSQKLSAAHPGRHFAIEESVGAQFVRRQAFTQAALIAGGLLGDPTVHLAGVRLLGMSARFQKKHHQSYSLYADVCQQDPEDLTSCIWSIEGALEALEPNQAVAYIRSVYPRFRKGPNVQAEYWQRLARAQFKARAYDEAYVAARRALGYQPKHVAAYRIGVKALVKAGNFREAQSLIDRMRRRSLPEADVAPLANEVSASRLDASLLGRSRLRFRND